MPSILVPRPAMQKPPAGSFIDLSHLHAQGLIASWDVLEEESFNLRDSIGSINGTFNGAARWEAQTSEVSATSGYAPTLGKVVGTSGSASDFLEVANDVRFDTTTFSVEIWFRTPVGMSVATNPWLWGRDTSVTRHGWEMLFTTGPVLRISLMGLQILFDVATPSPTDGNWHHVVLNVDSTRSANAYYDARFQASITPSSFDYTGATTTRWFKSLDAFWGVPATGIQVGPCRWRNRNLTADEVKWLYQEPYAMFRGPEVSRRYWYFRSAVVTTRRRTPVIG